MYTGLRKIVAPLVLACLMAVSAGCSPATSGEGNADGSNGPIKIGAIEPLSGAAATSGARVVNGMKIAIEEINAAGGILGGRQLKLIVEDGKSDPSESLNAVEKLMTRDKVHTIIGAYASSATLAVMPKTQAAKIPLLTEISTSPQVTESGNKYVFRTASTNGIDAQLLAKELVNLGFKKVAFLAVNNDFGRSVVQAYGEALKQAGATIVSTQEFPQLETNFLPFLTKIKNSEADAIIATTDIESLSALAKQIDEAGLKNLKRLSTSGNPSSLLLSMGGQKAANGWYLVEYYTPVTMEGGDVPANKAFTEKYAKAYPSVEPEYFAAQGYVSIKLLADAIAKAGSTGGPEIREAMATTTFETIRGQLKFDETGQVQARVYLTQVQDDGKVKLIIK